MTDDGLGRFGRDVERAHVQYERGILSDEEHARLIVDRWWQTWFADDRDGLTYTRDELIDRALELEWAPIELTAAIGAAMRHRPADARFATVVDRFRRAVARTADADTGERVAMALTEVGIDRLPTSLADEHAERIGAIAATGSFADDGAGPEHDPRFLPAGARVRALAALEHGEPERAIAAARDAWRLARRPQEFVHTVADLLERGEHDLATDALRASTVDELVDQEVWSAVAALAVVACGHRLDGLAAELSARVDETQVPDGSDPEAAYRRIPSSGLDPWDLDRNDLRILGPLAAVDVVTGEIGRAGRRAAPAVQWDGWDWHTAGHHALALWSLQTGLDDPAARIAHLRRIAVKRHVWLGSLAGRVMLELARLELAAGDREQAVRAFGDAVHARGRHRSRLHFGTFHAFEPLLARFALDEDELVETAALLGVGLDVPSDADSPLWWHLSG